MSIAILWFREFLSCSGVALWSSMHLWHVEEIVKRLVPKLGFLRLWRWKMDTMWNLEQTSSWERTFRLEAKCQVLREQRASIK